MNRSGLGSGVVGDTPEPETPRSGELVQRLEAFVRAVVRDMSPRADVEEALDLIREREALLASLSDRSDSQSIYEETP